MFTGYIDHEDSRHRTNLNDALRGLLRSAHEVGVHLQGAPVLHFACAAGSPGRYAVSVRISDAKAERCDVTLYGTADELLACAAAISQGVARVAFKPAPATEALELVEAAATEGEAVGAGGDLRGWEPAALPDSPTAEPAAAGGAR